MSVKHYKLSILLTPALDVPGQWIGHVLEHDIISVGNSARHALDMVQEATAMLLAGDLAGGRAQARDRAPEEDWQKFERIVGKGDRVAAWPEGDPQVDAVAVIADMKLLVYTVVEAPRFRAKSAMPKGKQAPEFRIQGQWSEQPTVACV